MKIETTGQHLAPINSPTFIGVPLVPTATIGTSTTQIASTAFVTAALTQAQTDNLLFNLIFA